MTLTAKAFERLDTLAPAIVHTVKTVRDPEMCALLVRRMIANGLIHGMVEDAYGMAMDNLKEVAR